MFGMIVFLTFLCLIPKISFGDTCSIPTAAGIVSPKANVLLILDNSNSMDENFYGEAVGSYSPNSKSVVARKSLINLIEKYKNKLRVGLLSYHLNSVSQQYIHNSLYFCSYEPKSYCPNHSKVCSDNTTQNCISNDECQNGTCIDPCVEYCRTGNSLYKTVCKNQCSYNNTFFDVDYFDEIITHYSIGSPERDKYCELIYPKTKRLINPSDNNHYIYYKNAYPFYSNSNQGIRFGYSVNYNPSEGCQWQNGGFCATDKYKIYQTKIGTSDSFSGYSNHDYDTWFGPTDTDIALGYRDFGRRLMWYDVGKTWFSNVSPGDGFLHVEIDDIYENGNYTSTYNNLIAKLDPKENDENGYMSCNLSDKNNCPYIINAGLTPTSGTLQTAIDYLTGNSNPIQFYCQKTYIVYVTDGLPSVNENGQKENANNLMPDVLSKLDILKNYRCSNNKNLYCTEDSDCGAGNKCVPLKVCENNYNVFCDSDTDCGGSKCIISPFSIKTYILGVGLTDSAKTYLDQMAVHGGTANNGHAYYADNPQEMEQALEEIFSSIAQSQGSAGAVATVTQQVEGEDIVVRGAFTTYDPLDPSTYIWQGHLEVYWPYEGCSVFTDENSCRSITGCTWSGGTCQGKLYSFQLPSNRGKFCSDAGFQGGNCWDAGEILKNQTTRTIFTYLNGNKVPLSTIDSSYFELDSLSDFNGDGSVDNNDVQKLKNWIQGTEDGDGIHMRNRGGWLLGDIVYSTPLVVGTPSLGSVSEANVGDCSCVCVDNNGNIDQQCADKCFYCYRKLNEHRDKVVYVGANDGMLHAFLIGEWDKNNYEWIYKDGEDPDGDGHKIGDEIWAYIPSNLLSELKCLAKPTYGKENGCQHRTMVDLSPEAWNVYIDVDGDGRREWRTVLIGGEREGGDVYFAIDVTDPHDPKVLWEYSVLRNMIGINGYQAFAPYFDLSTYKQIKNLPVSWSKPYIGKLYIDNQTEFYALDPFNPLDNKAISLKTYNGNQLSGWVAFVGTAVKKFDTNNEVITGDGGTELFPHLLAIDVEKGINILQFIWPYLRNQVINSIPNNTNYIPYVMSDSLAIDTNDNGYIDNVLTGDFNGNFWNISFDDSASFKISLDIMKTKAIDSSIVTTNIYRSLYEPITVEPVASFDEDDNIWVYFGTGKFSDVIGGSDDKTDEAKMSFYGLKLTSSNATTAQCTVTGNNPFTINCSGGSVNVHNCSTFGSDCSWIKNGQPDSCNSCWTCVYNFKEEGERVVASATVVGGLVFVTTFVPSDDPCSGGGYSYLYAFSHTCGYLDQNPFKGSSSVEYLDKNNTWQQGTPPAGRTGQGL